MRSKKSSSESKSLREVMLKSMKFSVSEYLGFTDKEIGEMASMAGIKISLRGSELAMGENSQLKDLEQYNEQIVRY